MDAVDSLGDVLLVVDIGQLEQEEIGEAGLGTCLKKVISVVGVTKLQLGILKDALDARWLKETGKLGQNDTSAQVLFELGNTSNVLANAGFDPSIMSVAKGCEHLEL